MLDAKTSGRVNNKQPELTYPFRSEIEQIVTVRRLVREIINMEKDKKASLYEALKKENEEGKINDSPETHEEWARLVQLYALEAEEKEEELRRITTTKEMQS